MKNLLCGLLGAAWLLTATLPLAAPAAADEATTAGDFTAAQEEAIGQIVREYLLENPEVLVEALNAYEARQQQVAEERQRQAVVAHQSALADDGMSPVLGNPDGDVVIVEFFDYRCPYCKKVADELLETVEKDGGVRLVMKEFPILGPDSIYAARAALAADKQGRYKEFHFALMDINGQIDEPAVMAVAKLLDLDIAQLEQDMASDEVELALRRNYELAEALEIGGTPAFVVGDTLVPGAVDMSTLEELIARIRAKAS